MNKAGTCTYGAHGKNITVPINFPVIWHIQHVRYYLDKIYIFHDDKTHRYLEKMLRGTEKIFANGFV